MLLSLAAALAPVSYLPTLRRMVSMRTADGMTTTLCVWGLASYSVWLVLAWGINPGMYVILTISSSLALVQFHLVRKWSGSGPRSYIVLLVAVLFAATVALFLPWFAVVMVSALDAGWNGRAVMDVLRSEAAHAVSVWSWVMFTVSYSAYAVEAVRTGPAALILQCLLLLAGTVCVTAATVYVKLRPRNTR